MGDDETIDQSLDFEVEEKSVNGDEKIPNTDSDPTFSDTVKALSNNSIKKIRRWNNEAFLYAFDRQLISFGLRLLLFLPGFAILTFLAHGPMLILRQIGGIVSLNQL